MQNNNPKIKVLLIDDDKAFKEMYRTYLESHGFEFFTPIETRNMDESKKLALEASPNIILLDIIMPEKTEKSINAVAEQGWEFLAWIKSDESLKNIPIIVFSCLSSEDDRKKAKILGADTFIFKNEVLPKDMPEIIKKWIQ